MLRSKLLRRARIDELATRTLTPRGFSETVDAIRVRVLTAFRGSRAVQVLVLALVLCVVGLVAFSAFSDYQARVRNRASRLARQSEVASVVPSTDEAVVAEPLWQADSVDARLLWLESENDLTRLRRVWDERGKIELRRRLLKIGGADERTRRRIEALSSAVAADVLDRAAGATLSGYADVEAVALAVRALLGSGSTPTRGPQQVAVRRGVNLLTQSLPQLAGPELATALLPCLEAALVSTEDDSDDGGDDGGDAGGDAGVDAGGDAEIGYAQNDEQLVRVGSELQRLVRDELAIFDALAPQPIYPERAVPLDHVFRDRAHRACVVVVHPEREPSRGPSLGSIEAPSGAIADAGLLLRVAPALGAEPGDVVRLRSLLDATLRRRSAAEGASGAAARAARLVAFAGEDERSDLRRSLQAYRIHPDRFGRDVRALLDLAWGVFPGVGWARFNQAMRYTIANYDEETARERAGLLLVQLLWTEPVPTY